MKKYRVAVVGCGSRSHAHIEAYQHIDNAQVVACCAPSNARRDEVAHKFGIKAYADAETMIRQEKPDLVHLVTWPDTRVELMTLVAKLGVPACTVEKPIAVGVLDWKRLSDLSAESRTRFAVCHQLRWHPNLMKCQDALKSGKLGRVLLLELSAGMNIAGQGTHALNYALSLNDDSPVVSVFGNAHGFSQSDPRHPAPDTTAAYLTFDNGVRGIWTSGAISPRCGDPETVWQHVRICAYAEKGRVAFEEFGKWEIVGTGNDQHGTFGGMDGFVRNNLLAQAGFHRAMLRWLEDDTQIPGTNLKQSLHEWAVVLALYQSAIEHRPVRIAGLNPPEDLFQRLSVTVGK